MHKSILWNYVVMIEMSPLEMISNPIEQKEL